MVEGEDEGDEVERERQHPEEWHARDVLGDVVGDCQQHHRAHRRKREPQQLILQWNWAPSAHCLGALRGAIGRHESHRTADPGEAAVDERPAPAELSQVEGRLEQQREAEQREERGEVRKREQAIRHHALEATPVPRLEERRRRREQEIGQPDRRAQEKQDAQDRLFVALRLPAARRDDRQAGERNGEQRHMQVGLAARPEPRRPVGVGIAGEKHALEEDEAGGPDHPRAAEPRQDLLGDDRLHQEQQERRKEYRRRVRQRGDDRVADYLSTDLSVLPISAGLRVVLMPHSSITASFSWAVPLPPEMMAPAWPMRLPGGAVTPAMKPMTGFFMFAFTQSAAFSSSEPPISPTMITASVLGSSLNILRTSMCLSPLTGSPPMPTQLDWPRPSSVSWPTAS